MKGWFKLFFYTVFLYSVFLSGPVRAEELQATTPPSSAINSNQISKDPKIQNFLKTQTDQLSSDFPYKINLFKQGQTDKNNAGLRIAETANQFLTDNAGLLFYYDLVNNAMRVPHWHSNATEIGTVLEGKMRVTIWEGTGDVKIFTVEKNGTWIIPKTRLHALENVGEGNLKFLVSYDSPVAADRDFLTAWASLPNAILARAVGLTETDIEGIKKTTINRLSGFDPAASPQKADNYNVLSSNFQNIPPVFTSNLGSIARVDSKINPHMNAMALQRTLMKPGVLRIPHWYTSGDVLFFVAKGNAFFTMMDDNGKVYHSLIERGDLISIPVGNFHSFMNIGNEDLEVYEAFNKVDVINEITLLNGVQHFSIGTIQGATNLDTKLVEKMNQTKMDAYMIPF
ncbi:MAG: cupin domain-containing protein [Legionella sp.]|nr:cupin domain-containing protein [Legionella sp.]